MKNLLDTKILETAIHSDKKIVLSLVVPCYNEEEVIPLFYDKAVKICESKNEQFEFIFIDDGSIDKTSGVLRELAAADNRVHYISFSRNFGKEAAILAGLKNAKGDYIVLLDADLQHPPSLIPEMLDYIQTGEYDCIGTLRTRKGDGPIRNFFTRGFYKIMSKLTNMEMIDGAGDFRLMTGQYVQACISLCERNRFSKGIFPWVGFRIKWLKFDNAERAAGTTKWSLWRLFLYSLDGITAFSSKLLGIASILGILFFLISIGIIIFIIIHHLLTMNTPDPWAPDGWTSTACIILFCSGIQLFTIGILGQYISKIYTEVKQRPYYIVREEK
jgi:glycosyltransferase involved in cell wall biosynthesis